MDEMIRFLALFATQVGQDECERLVLQTRVPGMADVLLGRRRVEMVPALPRPRQQRVRQLADIVLRVRRPALCCQVWPLWPSRASNVCWSLRVTDPANAGSVRAGSRYLLFFWTISKRK